MEMRQLQDQIDGLRLMAGGPERALQGIATMLGDHLSALTANLTSLVSTECYTQSASKHLTSSIIIRRFT
jgi:hypothetical protein